MKKIFLICALICLALGGEESEGKALYKKGWDAYERGNYKEALEFFIESSKLNDKSAYYGLGILYQFGWGVKQDYFKSIDFFSKSL